jgi:hypothetical protein
MTPVVNPSATGVEITPIDVSTPLSQAGAGTIFLTRLTPGYILGHKKRSQVGSQSEPPLPELPIEIPIAAGSTVGVSIEEVTTGIDQGKTGLRTYLLKVQDDPAGGGKIIFQQQITFDAELSTTTFHGEGVGPTIFTPKAFKPGTQFQFGSEKQPDLSVNGFVVAGV